MINKIQKNFFKIVYGSTENNLWMLAPVKGKKNKHYKLEESFIKLYPKSYKAAKKLICDKDIIYVDTENQIFWTNMSRPMDEIVKRLKRVGLDNKMKILVFPDTLTEIYGTNNSKKFDRLLNANIKRTILRKSIYQGTIKNHK